MLRHEECTRESPDDPERRFYGSARERALSRIAPYDEALLSFAEFEGNTQALVEFTDPPFRDHACRTFLRFYDAAEPLMRSRSDRCRVYASVAILRIERPSLRLDDDRIAIEGSLQARFFDDTRRTGESEVFGRYFSSICSGFPSSMAE